jgi:hypothetical protein
MHLLGWLVVLLVIPALEFVVRPKAHYSHTKAGCRASYKPQKGQKMPPFNFDDRNIRWNKLEGIEHLLYSIFEVDEKNKIVDVLFKFSANQQIVLHRHKAPNNMLVIQGEHRLYEVNGDIKDIRPVGRYTVSPASDEPHREGGGNGQDAVVFFSIRGSDDVLYEILDDDLNLIGALNLQDFIALKAQQDNGAEVT